MERVTILDSLNKGSKKNIKRIIERASIDPLECIFWNSNRMKLGWKQTVPRVRIKLGAQTKTVLIRNIIYCVFNNTLYTRKMSLENICGTENCLNPGHLSRKDVSSKIDDDTFDDTSSVLTIGSESSETSYEDITETDFSFPT
jgi:hypothetical protein